MKSSIPTTPPRVLAALETAASMAPLARKLLVCPRVGIGRELLRSLAGRGVPWLGFEVTTPIRLAQTLIDEDLAHEGLTVADLFDELGLLDAAIDAVLEGAEGRLAELAEGVGLRQAVARSVQGLRMAGIDARSLERARFRDEDKRAQIARILDEYEQRLRESRRVDAARIYERATARLDIGDTDLDEYLVFVLPGQSARGRDGAFLNALIARGAVVLDSDPVFGLDVPVAQLHGDSVSQAPEDALRSGATPLAWLHDVSGWRRTASNARVPDAPGDVILDVFAATSLTAELREVLRRVVAAGLHWDEVEIIATDARAYGVALDGIAQRLGIPVSYAAGLPAARTRSGRAVAKYLEWIAQDFPADILRQMFEHDDIGLPDAAVSGIDIARRLRLLRIGHGRERYEAAFALRERIIDAPQSPDDERSPAEFAEERARERAEIAALATVTRALLDATPPVPDRADGRNVTVSPADLARGLITLLRFVPDGTGVDDMARAEMLLRLERMAASLTRRTTLAAAIAIVTSRLAVNVPASEAEGGSSWTSIGGHLHLSDLEHGGYAARSATFVVGLDASRFPGTGSDALLVDDDRRRLTSGQRTAALPTAAERLDERRYAFAAMVSRLRGRVTFSYAMWDAVEGRGIAPASELLQAYRLLSGDATADYEALHGATAPAASAVPRGTALLDSDDVWLNALAYNGALRRGVITVCDTYPHLRAGALAWKARRQSATATAYHGMVMPREAFDPRDNPQRIVSATQLQTLGTCPLRYLHRYVLHVKKPDDPQIEPEQWLPPIEKGSLMHAVYERSLGAVLRDGIDVADGAFENIVLDILDEEIERKRDALPPPGDAVFAAERDSLREDTRAFIAMVREDGPRFIELEYRFGPRSPRDAVPITLPDGRTLYLGGAIDRVDRLDDGRLVVIDYKTGSSFRFGERSGVLDGGRRLQHVLYAEAASRLFGADVARVEYHFPTRRAENARARYERERLRDGLAVVTDLLDLAARGAFVPTNVPDDCSFCDFANVCRVRVDAWGRIASPLAEWSREAGDDAVDVLRRVRR